MIFDITKLPSATAFDINKLQPVNVDVDYKNGSYIVIINNTKLCFDDYGSAKEAIENSLVA